MSAALGAVANSATLIIVVRDFCSISEKHRAKVRKRITAGAWFRDTVEAFRAGPITHTGSKCLPSTFSEVKSVFNWEGGTFLAFGGETSLATSETACARNKPPHPVFNTERMVSPRRKTDMLSTRWHPGTNVSCGLCIRSHALLLRDETAFFFSFISHQLFTRLRSAPVVSWCNYIQNAKTHYLHWAAMCSVSGEKWLTQDCFWCD